MIGPGTYPQGNKFSLVRSFISSFGIINTWTITSVSGPNITLIDLGNPPYVFHVNLELKFFVWTSNYFSLDYVMKDSYYTEIATGISSPMPFTLKYWPATPTTPSCVGFQPFGAPPPFQYVPLLPAPGPYWLPLL